MKTTKDITSQLRIYYTKSSRYVDAEQTDELIVSLDDVFISSTSGNTYTFQYSNLNLERSQIGNHFRSVKMKHVKYH
jgi:hypothetical protein